MRCRKRPLLARWSFDEGNGTKSTEKRIRVNDANLEGAGWSSGIIIVSFALDQVMVSPSRPEPSARLVSPIFCGFKSNGLASGYSQILSKRDGTLSPYFIQVERGGSGIKSLFRFFATYFDNGTLNKSLSVAFSCININGESSILSRGFLRGSLHW